VTRARRLAPDEMFPRGVAGHEVRWLTLPDGLRVRAVLCEPPEPRDDAPVALFVHGWGCSVYSWRRTLRAVADAGIRALAFDLKGHGLSGKPLGTAHYTLPSLARHVTDVLDALELDRVVLVGHSMGGAISLRLALDAPERVAGLVLPAPIGFGAVSWMHLIPWLAPRPVEWAMPYLAFRWTFRVGLWRAYGHLGRPTARDVDEYWAPTRDPAFMRVLCELARAFEWTEGRPEELARVACPVEIVFGSRDHLVRPDICAPYIAHLREGRAQTIPEAGHALPEEVPDVMNAIIVDAVRRFHPSREPRVGRGGRAG
jgi:pimeloyl-ACP methyl ester carboxylesterase